MNVIISLLECGEQNDARRGERMRVLEGEQRRSEKASAVRYDAQATQKARKRLVSKPCGIRTDF